MWLSGRASPCQGEGREFESRHPLQYAKLMIKLMLWLKFVFLCGCSSVVEPQPSKLVARVRFPSPAPEYYLASLAQLDRASGYGPEGLGFESSMTRHKK